MKKKALIIGIDEYSRNKLNCCVNDARCINELLRNNGDGSKNFDSKILINNEATLTMVQKEIKELLKYDDDIALLYFAGHGCDSNDDGYIICSDYKGEYNQLDMKWIAEEIKNSKVKHKIIILDCCYSGKFGDIVGDNTELKHGTVILTASRNNEVSKERKEHGVFSKLLVDALEGGAADILGNITPSSVYTYADQALSTWEQRPFFKASVSGFICLRNIKPKIEIIDLKYALKLFYDPNANFVLDSSFEDTNYKGSGHNTNKPYYNEENGKKFKHLQKLNRLGLVIPVDEEHMYFAAMNNKACKLTYLGKHYWNLIKENKI